MSGALIHDECVRVCVCTYSGKRAVTLTIFYNAPETHLGRAVQGFGSWVSVFAQWVVGLYHPQNLEQLGRPRRLFVVRLCGRGTIAPPREQPANMSRLLDTKKGQRRQKYEFCVVPPPCRNRPIYSVARATGWPRPAEARGSLRRDLAPRGTPLRASFWPKTVPPCVRHRCSACERRHGKTGCCGAAWPKSPA